MQEHPGQHVQVGMGRGRSPGRDGANAGVEKPSAHEQPVGCSSFVQEATREGSRSGLGRVQGPGMEARGVGDGHRCSVQAPTQHRPRGHTHVSVYSKSKNRQMKIPHTEIKAVRMTPNPLQMKNVTPWARGRGRKTRPTQPGDTVFGRAWTSP